MVLKALLLIILGFIVVGSVSSRYLADENGMGEVIFANVLYRHGARTLKTTYPSDPLKNISYWPEGYGELTNEGKLQHYELGKWLRNRYNSTLLQKYHPDIIYVRSTDVNRTLASALCNLAGMFPPTGDEVWSPDLNWQPVPLHTVPGHLDKKLSNHFPPCPEYEKEFKRVLEEDSNIKDLNQKYSEVYEILNNNMKVSTNITALNGFLWVNDILTTEESRNLTLPPWTRRIFPQPLKEAAKHGLILETYNTKLARLRSGLLIKELISNMVDKKENKTRRSMHVYSAHDRTLSNLLHALGAFNFEIPPFAACVMVELRATSKGDHYVALFYRNSSSESPHLLTVPGCTQLCPLDEFIKMCKPLIPEDWDQECQELDSFFFINIPHLVCVIIIVGVIVVAVIAVIVITSILVYWKKQGP